MNLQNINLNYTDDIYSSLSDDNIYILTAITEMSDFKNSIESSYSVSVSKMVIQITYDQSLSEPRIVVNATENNSLFVTLLELETNFPVVYNQYLILKEQVIEQINNR